MGVNKNKWARGIPPRYFTWVLKDRLAIAERPGGYSRSHRPVRRQEEIIWLREQGFTRIVSMLASPHNLRAYEELHMPATHVPLQSTVDLRDVLPELFVAMDRWLANNERLLVHMEEVGDRLIGIMGAYLIWRGFPGTTAQAIGAVERITLRQMGPDGREVMNLMGELRDERRAQMATRRSQAPAPTPEAQ